MLDFQFTTLKGLIMTKKTTPNEKTKPSPTAESSVAKASVAAVKKTDIPSNTASVEAKTMLPVAKDEAKKQSKKDKPKKIKMIRDSFTLPEGDYAKLAELKKKCLEAGVHVKKSELMRAGILRLSKLNRSALLQAVAQVEIIKTGRPAKE